jgi:hypothetical protein
MNVGSGSSWLFTRIFVGGLFLIQLIRYKPRSGTQRKRKGAAARGASCRSATRATSEGCMAKSLSPLATALQDATASHSKNALCTARIACSPLLRSITTEILISLVEIMSMFTPSCARVSNILAATPE